MVFGYHDDERATRELNALNRIKEVRHPFLLSWNGSSWSTATW